MKLSMAVEQLVVLALLAPTLSAYLNEFREVPVGWVADHREGSCWFYHGCKAPFPPSACKPTGLTPAKKGVRQVSLTTHA